ncbi:hypothetical protein P4O66_021679 [Electrophorus voltai]|uniref:DM2 domain-containing protein n=1 Tax=Electrophorus voltai TaxID=2609070 RepID=A0AAD9E5Q4_9TELE|nr:hypothetical protein P4O66_021679 [Electrophorus voltai]
MPRARPVPMPHDGHIPVVAPRSSHVPQKAATAVSSVFSTDLPPYSQASFSLPVPPQSVSYSPLTSETGGVCQAPEANRLWDVPRAAGERRTVGEGSTSGTGADVHPRMSIEATDTFKVYRRNVVGSVPDCPERGREAAFLPLTVRSPLLAAPGLPGTGWAPGIAMLCLCLRVHSGLSVFAGRHLNMTSLSSTLHPGSGSSCRALPGEESRSLLPKASLLQILRDGGAQEKVFTLKEVMHYLGQYIIVKELYDKQRQHIVHCQDDPLGELMEVESFSVKNPSPVYEMLKRNLFNLNVSLLVICHERVRAEQPAPPVVCVQSGTVSVHPRGRLCPMALGGGEGRGTTAVGVANGERVSLFVPQSFLLCPVAFSGWSAAPFATHQPSPHFPHLSHTFLPVSHSPGVDVVGV